LFQIKPNRRESHFLLNPQANKPILKASVINHWLLKQQSTFNLLEPNAQSMTK